MARVGHATRAVGASEGGTAHLALGVERHGGSVSEVESRAEGVEMEADDGPRGSGLLVRSKRVGHGLGLGDRVVQRVRRAQTGGVDGAQRGRREAGLEDVLRLPTRAVQWVGLGDAESRDAARVREQSQRQRHAVRPAVEHAADLTAGRERERAGRDDVGGVRGRGSSAAAETRLLARPELGVIHRGDKRNEQHSRDHDAAVRHDAPAWDVSSERARRVLPWTTYRGRAVGRRSDKADL